MRKNWGSDHYEGGAWLPFNWYSIPVTKGLLFATVGTFLAFFFLGQGGGPVATAVAFESSHWLTRPWTWFLYPFLETPSIWILLTLYVLYSWGGMLERSWGSLNFAVLFFAFTAISALAFVIPLYLMGQPVLLIGLSMPLMCLLTAWAALDPELEVGFWGVPVKAKFLAAMWVGLNFFMFGQSHGNPWLAFFTLVGPAAAFFYVRKLPRLNLGGLPGMPRIPRAGRASRPQPLLREDPPRGSRETREPRERVPGSPNPLRRRQEQQEIERLRRLLGEDDDGRPTPLN
jgi:membrane associated rhomboid family serine protease